MKKYTIGFYLLALLIIIVGIAVYTLEKKSAPISTKTYTNNGLHYSIEYPSTWVVENYAPDALNNDVRIHPNNPEILQGMPAEYIHIRLENYSLAAARKIAASKVGGNDMTELEITFAGQTAYFYSHPDYPANPNETTPSIIFRGIILEHNGRVISIYTHKYQLPEVRQALDSFKFIP